MKITSHTWRRGGMSFPEGKQENNNLHMSHYYSMGLTPMKSQGKLKEDRLSFEDEIRAHLLLPKAAINIRQMSVVLDKTRVITDHTLQ